MDKYTSLRDLRYHNGDLSQKDMAQLIGVSLSMYSLMERGLCVGSRKVWLTIQDKFNLSDGEVWRLQNGDCAR